MPTWTRDDEHYEWVLEVPGHDGSVVARVPLGDAKFSVRVPWEPGVVYSDEADTAPGAREAAVNGLCELLLGAPSVWLAKQWQSMHPGVSQVVLARKLAVGQGSVSWWLSGKQQVSMPVRYLMLHEMGFKTDGVTWRTA